jgi:hypothetical protein
MPLFLTRPRDVRQKLQKPDRFAGMNASQLLEVATKVFVNQDQARREANRKMKRKVDLLVAAGWTVRWALAN